MHEDRPRGKGRTSSTEGDAQGAGSAALARRRGQRTRRRARRELPPRRRCVDPRRRASAATATRAREAGARAGHTARGSASRRSRRWRRWAERDGRSRRRRSSGGDGRMAVRPLRRAARARANRLQRLVLDDDGSARCSGTPPRLRSWRMSPAQIKASVKGSSWVVDHHLEEFALGDAASLAPAIVVLADLELATRGGNELTTTRTPCARYGLWLFELDEQMPPKAGGRASAPVLQTDARAMRQLVAGAAVLQVQRAALDGLVDRTQGGARHQRRRCRRYRPPSRGNRSVDFLMARLIV